MSSYYGDLLVYSLFAVPIISLISIIIILMFIAVTRRANSKASMASSQPAHEQACAAPPSIPDENVYEYKICPMCGEEIKSVAIKCKHCNSMLQGKEDNSAISNTGEGTLGTISLITGIVGFFIGILLVHLGVLLGVTAVVCGVLGQSKGQKYALPGIVIGIVAVIFSLIYSVVSMLRF